MSTYIFDIDGTLADASHRLHLIDRNREGGPDWDAFFAACIDDRPILSVIAVLNALKKAGHEIVYATGRPFRTGFNTERWLCQQGCPGYPILFRDDDDHRPDTIVKKEKVETIVRVLRGSDHEVAGIFEDRPSVVRVWREMGLTVFQVGDGKEF